MKNYYALFFLFSISLSAQLQWRPLTTILDNPNNQRFDDVFFLNENLGWAANGAFASVYKTTDGGLTWVLQLSETILGGNYYFRNIEFLNENVGFLGTLNGVFFKTIDGGDNWTIVSNIPTNPLAICGLDTVGSTTIYGCGAYFTPAYIIKSNNSGETWQYIDMSAYANALVEILFIDENIGFASGSDTNGGLILKTTDGGQTWTPIYHSTIPGEYVWKLEILSSNNNVIFGSVESVAPLMGRLLKTTNSGVNWTEKDVPFTHFQGVGFINENHGWIGGYSENLSIVPIYETTDGGDTWNDIATGSNLNRIFIVNENLAYASGTTIYKYSDINLGTGNFKENNRIPLKVIVEPNPVKDKLNITIEFMENDHLVLELFDQVGHLIKVLYKDDISQAGKKTYSFDFPYASAVYLVSLHTNTGRQTIKFIK